VDREWTVPRISAYLAGFSSPFSQDSVSMVSGILIGCMVTHGSVRSPR
jgi:hypothetical protein